MKKALLIIPVLLILGIITAQSQSFYYGFQTKPLHLTAHPGDGTYPIITGVDHFSPAAAAGLLPLDIILKVNGQPVKNREVGDFHQAEELTLEVQRFGKVISAVKLKPIACAGTRRAVSEFEAAEKDPSNWMDIFAGRFNEKDYGIDILHDPESDMLRFAYFDFKYTDAENPLMQKKAAAVLQRELESMGLKRDPDKEPLLTFIVDMYSEFSEQFVQPTEKLQTKYRFGWETDGWKTRPYTMSTTIDGYMQAFHRTGLRIIAMDGDKLKENPEIPPILWQAEYGFTNPGEKPDMDKVATEIISAMMLRFPFEKVDIKRDVSYNYTGLLFDEDKPHIVTAVLPGSPAEHAGILPGDVLKKVKSASKNPVNRFRRGSFRGQVTWKGIQATPTLLHYPTQYREGAGREQTRRAYYHLRTYSHPNLTPYMYLCTFPQETSISFTVSRDGKSHTFKVIPEIVIGERYHFSK